MKEHEAENYLAVCNNCMQIHNKYQIQSVGYNYNQKSSFPACLNCGYAVELISSDSVKTIREAEIK